MKQLLLLAFFLVPAIAFSQATLPIDTVTKKVNYTGVVQAEGLGKDEIYLRAKSWFVSNIKPLKDAIQLDDKDNGKLIGKGAIQTHQYRVTYSVDITCKDGKYRYIFADFTYQNNPNEYVPRTDVFSMEYILNYKGNIDKEGNYKKSARGVIDTVDTEMAMFISGLKAATSAIKAKDDF